MTVLDDAADSDRRASDAARKAKGKRRGNNNGARQKQDKGSASLLQVAFLVAMPSPLRTQIHDGVGQQQASESTLRDELAIGLIEMPWISEDPHSFKKIAS